MQNLRRLLPSAGNLVIFESAGRLNNFTAAARELGMTQAAVSYAIRNLENELGAPLFTRAHRRVLLTGAGERFHADVSLGLSHIRKSAEAISAFKTEAHVTLSVSNAVATMWMVPRLQQAREALPGIELRLHTSDRDLDIAAENIPLGIRGGKPAEWTSYDSSLFAEEEIIAVASPAYLARHGIPAEVRALANHSLIHLEEPWRAAPTWGEWFASAGAALPSRNRGLVINDYVSVIQAALDGQGVALGWRHLIELMLGEGRLKQVTSYSMHTGSAFHVVWQKNRALSANAQKVRDWLIGEAP
jgi:DNA-binding transcriptional LysR family regulator